MAIAAILVLSTMGLPVALAGLLISIEPLIDMGRTAVNLSGAMTAGAVTSRLLGEADLDRFGDDRAWDGPTRNDGGEGADAGERRPLVPALAGR